MWRKNSWHRYHMNKLRHCHPMYLKASTSGWRHWLWFCGPPTFFRFLSGSIFACGISFSLRLRVFVFSLVRSITRTAVEPDDCRAGIDAVDVHNARWPRPVSSYLSDVSRWWSGVGLLLGPWHESSRRCPVRTAGMDTMHSLLINGKNGQFKTMHWMVIALKVRIFFYKDFACR